MAKKPSELPYIAILLIASSALILARLGNVYLWGDEAQTALLAKTVLKYGYPRGFDGRNYLSLYHGMEYGHNYVWRYHPWFPFYVLAGFFAALGTSTFVARLPFALFGIGTVVLTYYLGKALWGIRRIGVLAAVLLAICVPFLLLVRQCRYYAPAAFLSTAGLLAYVGILENRRRSWLAFIVCGTLLFHTHFVNCAAVLFTVAVHSLIFRRDKLKLVILLSAITAAVNLPWMLLFSGTGGALASYGGYAARSLASARFYIIQIPKHLFHPALLILPIAAYIIHRRRPDRPPPFPANLRQNLSLLLIFMAVSLLSTSLTNWWYFFRYLAPIIPVACILTALMIESGFRIHPILGVVAIGLLAWWWQMPSYLYEITHDYDGPTEGIVQYLNAHGRPSDVVVANHEDMPLKFYTKMRIISISSGEDLTPAKNADWVIMRVWTSADRAKAMRYLMRNIPWDQYEEITLPYPDIEYENREDLEDHHFRTVQDAEPVTIYRKADQGIRDGAMR